MKTKNFDMEISSPKHVQKHQLQLLCSRMDVFLRIQRPIKFTSNCFPQKNHVPHCFLSSETLPQSCVRYHILPFSWGKNTSMFATFKKHGKLFFQQLTTKALCLRLYVFNIAQSSKLKTLDASSSHFKTTSVRSRTQALFGWAKVGWSCFWIGCSWLFLWENLCTSMQTLRGTPAQKGVINASQTDMKTHEKPPISATKALWGEVQRGKIAGFGQKSLESQGCDTYKRILASLEDLYLIPDSEHFPMVDKTITMSRWLQTSGSFSHANRYFRVPACMKLCNQRTIQWILPIWCIPFPDNIETCWW